MQRAKSIYDEGRMAFGENDVQCCFICRTYIPDNHFSQMYFKNLSLVQVQGIIKQKGGTISNEEIVKVSEQLHQLTAKLGMVPAN